MKKLLLLNSLLFTLLFYSCTHACIDTALTGIQISNNDTMLVIKSYGAGGNFTNFLDSTVLYGNQGAYTYYFSAGAEYRILGYPSGKIDTLMDIQYGNQKGNSSHSSGGDQCQASVSYLLDDSLVNIAGLEGKVNAIVFIPN